MFGWLLALVLVAVVTLFLIGPQRIWEMTVGDPDLGALELTTLERTGRPNDALIAPDGLAAAAIDAQAPVFATSADELYEQLIARINVMNTVTWAQQDAQARYARAITRSPTLKFADTNHVWVLPVNENQATLALYAAAQMGYSDAGKNMQRLEQWIGLLDDIPRVQPSP